MFAVSHTRFERIVRCKVCDNTGKITIRGIEFICPKCRGKCTHVEYAGMRYYIAYSDAIVGRVTVEHTDEAYMTYAAKGETSLKITYMLDQTGVGSGQVWPLEHLFATRLEAQCYCDERNESLLQNECEPGKDIVSPWGEVLGGKA